MYRDAKLTLLIGLVRRRCRSRLWNAKCDGGSDAFQTRGEVEGEI